ncbi:MAG: bifunctional pyr operon transcriptional regulator/uracil phosphoribosyltransferase PyrR [Cytophagales bacterium]|nr:MAG: bifunctional pyr operon transcriptional regulator/uracil phosphoribosyltransferase [Rhodothermaeota bacterium MED-G19]
MTNKSRLFNKKRLDITINRLCHQLIEKHKNFENTVLIGLQPRGIYFLNRIEKNLNRILGKKIDSGILDTTFYRDDFRSKEIPKAKETLIPFLVDEKKVVIIDDVLFTGRTVRSAMEGIMNFGRPKKVELLVLVDRKYSRDIPVEPTYCGIKINTITSDRVEVNLVEQGFKEDNIWISNE